MQLYDVHCRVAVQSYIDEERKCGIDRSRIVVGGISQGGAVTLYSTFAIEQQPLAGVVVLSTWLPLYKSFPAVSCIGESSFFSFNYVQCLVRHANHSATLARKSTGSNRSRDAVE